MKAEMKFVRNNIRAFRNRAGLTQAEAAKKLGISRVMYCNYEVDPSLLKIKTLYKLAIIFGCKVSDFFRIE